MQIAAWHAANIMNVHLKKKVTPKKLLGLERKPMTIQERQEKFELLKELWRKEDAK